LIVFVGAIFSLRLTDPDALQATIGALVAFCSVSSAGYLFNDVRDVQADREHPTKRLRPIASGAITTRQAIGAAGLLTAFGLLLGWLVDPILAAAVASYLALTVAYSVWLKHLVLVDLFAIAGGFVLRMVGGAVVVDVRVSPWLYVCTILVALFLGLAKRRQELGLLEQSAGSHRRNLSDYTVELVDQLMTIVTSAILMAYSLYTFSAPNVPSNDSMMLTIPLVLYGLFRYLFLVRVKGLGGSPEELLLSDRPLLLTAVGWVTLCTALLYLQSVPGAQ
jgi:4-hydroxybenzoate polyprenyltransferase